MRVLTTGVFIAVLISCSAAWWENGLTFDFLSSWFGVGTRNKDATPEPDTSADDASLPHVRMDTDKLMEYKLDSSEVTESDDEKEDVTEKVTETDEKDVTKKATETDEKAIADKLERGKIQTYRVKLKIKELEKEYNEGIQRLEEKLDTCIETEITVTKSPGWWPTGDTTVSYEEEEEETAPPKKKRKKRSTPPYYLQGLNDYNYKDALSASDE